ncbi:MAG: SpoIIE family protein phosphatase [Bernardetiaceae bacterium]|nr:SpoIIE family protein phosphatase [Bernardetiaceae bacterium]
MFRFLLFALILFAVLPASAQAWDDNLERLVKIIAENKRDTRHVDALNGASDLLLSREPAKATAYAEEAARLALVLDYDAAQAHALANLGYLVAGQKNDHSKAADYFTQATRLYQTMLAQGKVNKTVVYDFATNRLIPAGKLLEAKGEDLSRREKKALKEYKILQGEFADLIAEVARLKEQEKERRARDARLDSAAAVLVSRKNELMTKDAELAKKESELVRKNRLITIRNREKQALAQINAELSTGLSTTADSLKDVLDSLEATAGHLQVTTETLLLHEMRLQQEAMANMEEKARVEKLQEEKRQQWWLVAGAGALVLLGAVFSFFVWRQLRLRKRLYVALEERNFELNQKNVEINNQKDEIEAQHNDILLQKEEIEAQRDDILAKNSQITSSIQYAQRIQSAILPDPTRLQLMLPESFILFMPRDMVSGDFYWFTEIYDYRKPQLVDHTATVPPRQWGDWPEQTGWGAAAQPGGRQMPQSPEESPALTGSSKIIVAAVDCTGHGVPGAFMSMIGNKLLDDIVHVRRITSPELILQELHRGVVESLRQRDTNNRDGMDIALCVIDRANHTLEFAGAMNPLIYIRDEELLEIKADKRSVGGFIVDDDRTFSKHTIDISRPGMYYIFSDGIPDQFGGPEKRKFMLKNLRNRLVQVHDQPPATQKSAIEKTIEGWRYNYGYNKQTDDILLIGFRV